MECMYVCNVCMYVCHVCMHAMYVCMGDACVYVCMQCMCVCLSVCLFRGMVNFPTQKKESTSIQHKNINCLNALFSHFDSLDFEGKIFFLPFFLQKKKGNFVTRTLVYFPSTEGFFHVSFGSFKKK